MKNFLLILITCITILFTSCNTFYIQGTPSGGRILTRENRQWILLDTVYYHDCGSNLYPGIFNCNSSKLL